ncbi:hypothetical protein P3S72_20430 [Pseudomonas sp. D3]|uniref:hypothetical protein n=1 Tax=Pseudomonas sp. D3 TaxID=517398 RepID=UPI0023E472B2|nr:hypothetical protein [Pseudomonas sp. D3]WET08855.1 hypothetical protein P3S72_20430 [Pseudomonas sp. D3]
MTEADNTIIQRKTLGEQTLSLTVEQLLDFIAAKGSDSPCEACGAKDWYYAQDDAGPTITTSSNVRSPNTASWFFFMSCNNCANTRFLEAGRVWEHYFGPNKETAK